MDRLTGNRLLALFEVDFDPSQIFKKTGIIYPCIKEEKAQWEFMDMKYHFSFDWQFKILEKIQSKGFQYTVGHNFCKIGSTGNLIAFFHNKMPIGSVQSTKEAVFRACVKFVEYYIKTEVKNSLHAQEMLSR
jgi:hypothetical protein